jgi:hypothetical protein
MALTEIKKKNFPLKSEANAWAKEQKAKDLDIVKWDVKREPQNLERPYRASLYKEI